MRSPGRFHISNSVKLIAIFFFVYYEGELTGKENLDFEFRDASVPSPTAKLILKKRIS
jgi:hypothetical protein